MVHEGRDKYSRCPILSPWLASGIGLSYKPASLYSLAGRHDKPMPESTISPQSGTKNKATENQQGEGKTDHE
jgi:hypothetical protein